mmetsp:Transcript_14071/g.42075  ORF Transcript_14071/g.42075 Transcript_14071/m.42075 type:complete len:390 (+) Transcript_14071:376-1545(+)
MRRLRRAAAHPLSAKIGFDEPDEALGPLARLFGGTAAEEEGEKFFKPSEPTVETGLPGRRVMGAIGAPFALLGAVFGTVKDVAYAIVDLPGSIVEMKEEMDENRELAEQKKAQRQREAEVAAEASAAASAAAQRNLNAAVGAVIGTIDAVVNAPTNIVKTVEETKEAVLAIQEEIKANAAEAVAAVNRTVDSVVYAPLRAYDSVAITLTKLQNLGSRATAVGKQVPVNLKALPERRAPPSFKEKMERRAQLAREAETAEQQKTKVAMALKASGLGAKGLFGIAKTVVTAPVQIAAAVRSALDRSRKSRERVTKAVELQATKEAEARARLEMRKQEALKLAREKEAAEAAEQEAKAKAAAEAKAGLAPEAEDKVGAKAGESEEAAVKVEV